MTLHSPELEYSQIILCPKYMNPNSTCWQLLNSKASVYWLHVCRKTPPGGCELCGCLPALQPTGAGQEFCRSEGAWQNAGGLCKWTGFMYFYKVLVTLSLKKNLIKNIKFFQSGVVMLTSLNACCAALWTVYGLWRLCGGPGLSLVWDDRHALPQVSCWWLCCFSFSLS